MARTSQSIKFRIGPTPYTSDRGTQVSGNFNFIIPPAMSAAQATDIVNAAGGQPTGTPAPCPDGNTFKPRKLRFFMADGASFSVPIASLTNLKVAAEVIKNIADPISPVVCIKLEGEEWNNLMDELASPTKEEPKPGLSSKPSAGKQPFWGQIMSFTSDVFGAIKFGSVKIASESDTAPPSLYKAQWTSCVGPGQSIASCGANERRVPRRYTATALVNQKNTTVAQVSEIPVASNAAADIKLCGQSIANNESVYCLNYRGESFDRVHRLLT